MMMTVAGASATEKQHEARRLRVPSEDGKLLHNLQLLCNHPLLPLQGPSLLWLSLFSLSAAAM